MRAILILMVGLAVIPALGGCAAGNNLIGKEAECKIYGGTRLDAELMEEGFGMDPKKAKSLKIEKPILIQEGCCGLFDMPLSFVADTLTLPITVPASIIKAKAGHGDEEDTEHEEDEDEDE